MGSKETVTITVNLHLLGRRLGESGKVFIRVHEIAYLLGVSPRTAGKILSALSKLGYVEKWSDGIYRIIHYNDRFVIR
ncbi:MAG: hypothetical protein J7K21_06280 [Desulfurococcales archaeon]|nr:hypothetical protein [Desulfurococcales archaeon]